MAAWMLRCKLSFRHYTLCLPRVAIDYLPLRTLARSTSSTSCCRRADSESDSNERGYLLETSSPIPTYHFQSSLPRLPIPSLHDTITRYLAAQRPFLSREQFQQTERVAREFAKEGSEGWRLHRELIEKDSREQHKSYVTDFWYDRYLKSRNPLPLGHSVSFRIKQDPREPCQIERAVSIIRSIVRYKNSLTDEKQDADVVYSASRINPELLRQLLCRVPARFSTHVALLAGAIPLNMSQYKRILGTTRVPHIGRDQLTYNLSSHHIAVMSRGNLYLVNVQQDNGLPVADDKLYSDLLAIVHDPSPAPSHPVNYLTATDRDSWADAREKLMSNAHNARALEKIESALFVLCLDVSQPDTKLDRLDTFLHNYGANRWFDKSLQIVVTPSAEAGVSFEHSCCDGGPLVSFMNKVYRDSLSSPKIPSSSASTEVDRIDFHLTDSLRQAVDSARVDIENRCQSFFLKIISLMDYDKLYWKQNGLSPNGALQLVFQIAYYRLYGRLVPGFLPCSTSTFLDGRTEWLRPGTMAAMACAEAMMPSSGASTADKVRLLQEAAAQLALLAKQAKMGQGFDRHLYALKCMAEDKGISLSLFEDPAYAEINQFDLNPSTVDGGCLSLPIYGPVEKDMISVIYMLNEGILVSGYSVEKVTAFETSVRTVLEDIRKLLLVCCVPATCRGR